MKDAVLLLATDIEEQINNKLPTPASAYPNVTAYFDESGHSDSIRAVAMGGAMTTPLRWGDLRVKWKTALDRHGVETLHMTDLENRKGAFEGWDEAKKRSLLTELFEAINIFPCSLLASWSSWKILTN